MINFKFRKRNLKLKELLQKLQGKRESEREGAEEMPGPTGLGRKTAKKMKSNFQITSLGRENVECARTTELYSVVCCKGLSTTNEYKLSCATKGNLLNLAT